MKKVISLLLVFLMLAQPVFAADEKVDVLVKNGGNRIEISGIAPCGGQNVTVQMLKPGISEASDLSDIVFQKQVIADENGVFSVAFTAHDSMETGTYPVQFFYESGQKQTISAEYKSTSDLTGDFAVLKETVSPEDTRRIIEKHGTEWNFDFVLYSTLPDASKNVVIEKFTALGGKTVNNLYEARDVFQSASVAVAIAFYPGDFADLVTGIYGENTGLSESEAYKEFSEQIDLKQIGLLLNGRNFENGETAHQAFDIEICLSVIANAKGWFDVDRAIKVMAPLLSLNMDAYTKTPEAIGMALAGKTFNSESFLVAFEREIHKNSDKKIIFEDVFTETDWASASVNALYEAGIVNGVNDGVFQPNGQVTREQFAKMIMAMLGDGEQMTDSGFSDVKSNEWYAPYVAMAKDSGIVNGVSKTAFGVGQPITREQMATMIYRAGQLLGYQTNGTPKIFTDGNTISDYAKDAVDALTAGGVINGMSDGSFAPHSTATRAEAACMIYNLMQKCGYTVRKHTGYQPIAATDPFVTYKNNFNQKNEEIYNNGADKFSHLGWYFVPGGTTTYLAVSPAPAGKNLYEIPFTEKQVKDGAKDMAVAIRAEKSTTAGHFDTKPFPLGYETSKKMRLEMNLYIESDNLSKDYKTFDSQFYSWVHMRGERRMRLFFFTGDGGVYYYGMGNEAIRCGSYAQKKWIHVAADFDAEREVYTLYLDGVAVAKDIPYNNSTFPWDGTGEAEPGLNKVRLRMSLTPDTKGSSITYIDDFILARYTDAPFVLPQIPKNGDEEIKIAFDESIKNETLKYITASVNDKPLSATDIQTDIISFKVSEALKSGDKVMVTVGKWVETSNGVLTGTPQMFSYTVE
ncbi:MAG: S-layer homology domain-containing protein [Clostridia bacterium]|nr:S-layer homology domain-containing protein [Clostridia bacterium]